MKPRIILAMVLLAGVSFPARALAQVSGSGGVADDRAAAAALVGPAAPVTFLTFTGRVDHAAAGTGLRNFDSGTIRLRGIPANSTVVRAFLYWAMICPTGAVCPPIVPIEFEGRTIDSRLLCTGAQPCWVAGATLGAYLVDVTGLMPGTTTAVVANKVINGDYQISRFPFHPNERDGRDPWVPLTALTPKVEGATLVVVYSNPSLSLTGRVHLHHGCDFFVGTLNVTNPLVPAAPSPILFAKSTRFGADGQVGTGNSASPITSEEKTFFGGPSANCAVAVLTQIAGDGSTRNHDSDWNGSDGGPLNQLWDTRTTTVTGLLRAGAANYCVRYVSSGDCMNAIGYALTLR
jgi:hypothetical protein